MAHIADAINEANMIAPSVVCVLENMAGQGRCIGARFEQLAAVIARVKDKRGVGVLHACALHGLSTCVRLLKSHGAPLDLVDGFDRTAADVASLLGYVDVAAELGGAAAMPMPGVRQTLRRPARAPD